MTQIYVERTLAIYRVYTTSARSGVIKAIASFCRVDSNTAFERHRSRIPINCDELETVQSVKKDLLSFLGLRELAMKFGFGEFNLKLYRMAPKQGGRSENFSIITDGQWKIKLPSLLKETGSELTLLEQGMRRLHDSIAATNKEYLEEVELCTLLTTVVENIYAVSHFKHETSTALQYSQDFGNITKETLQKTTMAFESIKFMQPLPSAEISTAETETAMKELVEKYRPVRQRTVRGETTKDKAGALPPAVYTKPPDCSKVNFMPDSKRAIPSRKIQNDSTEMLKMNQP